MLARLKGFVFVALLLAAALCVAFLSTRFGWQHDFSYAQRSSLDARSVDLLHRLDAPVAIVSYAGQDALIARIGGEEFVLILRQTSNVNVLAIADKIRKAFASASFDTTHAPFSTTTSAGIAFLTAADTGFETVFRRADAALYRAKDLGRNRICTELQIVA